VEHDLCVYIAMSVVALTVLRLEVRDDCDAIPNIDYQAKEYIEHTRERLSLLSSSSEYKVDKPHEHYFIQDPKLHWGNRIFQQYKIQTYFPTMVTSENLVFEEKEHKVDEDNSKSRFKEPNDKIGITPNKLQFFSGSHSMEITWGIMHLFKDRFQAPFDSDTPRSEMICILGVPAKCTCQELQKYIAPVRDTIKHIKVIRDSIPNNQYMVLIRFKDQVSADMFYREYEGKPFNLLEDEVSHLVYVSRVEAIKTSMGGYFPGSDLTELPTCPVCLERMDESVDGILTVLCNHSFHNDCLVKWQDTNCPVCRHSLTPEPSADQTCFECYATESLWICIICGYIGCGRYQEQHAYQHYRKTSHTYSMHLVNQRVWDYAGDNYVHRLIQGKGEVTGKVVAYNNNNCEDDKIDSLTLEYTYLLTNQLESQRLYFEEKIDILEAGSREKISLLESSVHQAEDQCRISNSKLMKCEKELNISNKKYENVVGKVGTLLKELRDEKELNKGLRENQSMWQEKMKNLECKIHQLEKNKQSEVAELQEQVNDLMRHLEVQSAIDNTETEIKEDIQGGQVFINQCSPPNNKQSKAGNGRKK